MAKEKEKKAKVETAAKPKFELPANIKFEILEAPALQVVKEKIVHKTSKFNPTAVSMSERMLKDINEGARLHLDTPTLQSSKDKIRKMLKKDLSRIAKKSGHRYDVRTVDEGQALVFYFQEKPPKKDKKAA